MRIILTVDVELWSWRRNFELDIEKSLKVLEKFSIEEKIPLTLFISLSDKGYDCKDYLKKISEVISKIKSENIKFGIHSHCTNLPLDFKTKSDNLKDYDREHITRILEWYKKELEKITNQKIIVHRAGSYEIPSLQVLKECFPRGLKIDSSDISQDYLKIKELNSLLEIPPATNRQLWAQHRVWSPEQLSFKEMVKFYNEAKKHTNLLIMNFHSFSVYGYLGKKARIWYKMPLCLRKTLKPFVNLVKGKKSVIGTEAKESKNFENFKNIVKFLKKEKCKFVSFENLR